MQYSLDNGSGLTGELVFQAHRLVYRSTLVLKKVRVLQQVEVEAQAERDGAGRENVVLCIVRRWHQQVTAPRGAGQFKLTDRTSS